MSSGRLKVVCKSTGESLPLEALKSHGFKFTVAVVVKQKHYFLPYKDGSEPPNLPPEATPEQLDAFFDEINGAVIRACRRVELP